MNNLPEKRENKSAILFYQTEDRRSHIEVRLEKNTVWLTQSALAELFQTTPQNITAHIRNIYSEGELPKMATCKDYLQVQSEGQRRVARARKFYNLDLILAVGYRVRSHRGTQFRRWATERLREYLVKGFTMDDQRLKEGRNIGADYFDELLERIRDIRASEKRFYQKIKDLYALAIDYDPNAETTLEFFKIVQNKMHWAVTGRTAAELIAGRANAAKPNMGLTSWKGTKVRQTDVTVAKNYLNADEAFELLHEAVELDPTNVDTWLGLMDFEHLDENERIEMPLFRTSRCSLSLWLHIASILLIKRVSSGLLSQTSLTNLRLCGFNC